LICPEHRQKASLEVVQVPSERVGTPTGNSPSHLNAQVPVVVRCVHAGAASAGDVTRATPIKMKFSSFIGFTLIH
jgi:hypothetical protein